VKISKIFLAMPVPILNRIPQNQICDRDINELVEGTFELIQSFDRVSHKVRQVDPDPDTHIYMGNSLQLLINRIHRFANVHGFVLHHY
jgi:hypothetical protein